MHTGKKMFGEQTSADQGRPRRSSWETSLRQAPVWRTSPEALDSPEGCHGKADCGMDSVKLLETTPNRVATEVSKGGEAQGVVPAISPL